MRTDNTLAPHGLWSTVEAGFAAVTNVAAQGAADVQMRVSGLITQLRISRTEASLRALSDDQLARFGVTRDGIRAHAEELVTYKYDGL